MAQAVEVYIDIWTDAFPARPDDLLPVVEADIVNETGFAQFTQTTMSVAPSTESLSSWSVQFLRLFGTAQVSWTIYLWWMLLTFVTFWLVIPMIIIAILEITTRSVLGLKSLWALCISLVYKLSQLIRGFFNLPFIAREKLLTLTRGAHLSKVSLEPVVVPREVCYTPSPECPVSLNSIVLETACLGSQAIVSDVPRHVIILSAQDPAFRSQVDNPLASPLQIAGMATFVNIGGSADPVLVTALHVVEALEEAAESTRVFVQIRDDGPVSAPLNAFDFKVIGRATVSDVAVISVNSSFAAAFNMVPAQISHPRSNSLVTLWGVDSDDDQVVNVVSRGPIFAIPSDPPGILRHKATSTHGWSGTGLFQAFGGKMRLIGVHRGSIPGREVNVFHPIIHLFRSLKVDPETPWSSVLAFEEPDEEIKWIREEERLMEKDRRIEEAERRADINLARREARAEREQAHEEDDHFNNRYAVRKRGKMDPSLYYDESGTKVPAQRLNSLGAPSSTDSAEILETSMMEPVIKSARNEEQKGPAPPQELEPSEKSVPKASASCTMEVEELLERKTPPPSCPISTPAFSEPSDALIQLSQRLLEQEERMERQRLLLEQQALDKESRRIAKKIAHEREMEQLKLEKEQKAEARRLELAQKEEALRVQKAQKEAERQAAALVKAEVDKALAEERRKVKEQNIAKAAASKAQSDQRKAKKLAAKPKPDNRPLAPMQYDALAKLLQNMVQPTDPQPQSAPH